METKHTQGNWNLTFTNNGFKIVCTGKEIESVIVHGVSTAPPEEQKANAKVLAAASEMLTACIDAFDAFDLDDLSAFTQEQKQSLQGLFNVVQKATV